MAKLEVEHISMVFPGREREVEVLRDVSIRVNDGSFVSVVGPSGCGKSTLLRIVAGLLKPVSGRVLINGQPVTKSGRDRGMVFQDDSLLPWRTTMDNITFGLQIAGQSKQERNEVGQRLVNLVGLQNFENSFPYQLSGGMRQRANLARGLAIDPEVLLMDEPFASLDAQTRELMQAELLSIWHKAGKTVLFITHQIDEAIFLSDEVIVLGARPATVLTVLNVDIRRPRSLDIKRSNKFIEYMGLIWKMLKAEVQAG